MRELRPCPFCGERAKLSLAYNRCYYVSCSACDAQVWRKSKSATFAAWNKRSPELTHAAHKSRYNPRKVVFGIIAALGFFAMIGFCAADALTYAERMAYSVAGLLGFMVGAAVAGALGRGEDKP